MRSGRSSPATSLKCREDGLELERLEHFLLLESRPKDTGPRSDDKHGCEMSESCDISQPTIRYEIESQRAKVLSLETTIRQLREELRESKDQNELLEFRLLEIEELGSSSSSQVRIRL